jgi:hypothetical protein
VDNFLTKNLALENDQQAGRQAGDHPRGSVCQGCVGRGTGTIERRVRTRPDRANCRALECSAMARATLWAACRSTPVSGRVPVRGTRTVPDAELLMTALTTRPARLHCPTRDDWPGSLHGGVKGKRPPSTTSAFGLRLRWHRRFFPSARRQTVADQGAGGAPPLSNSDHRTQSLFLGCDRRHTVGWMRRCILHRMDRHTQIFGQVDERVASPSLMVSAPFTCVDWRLR